MSDEDVVDKQDTLSLDDAFDVDKREISASEEEEYEHISDLNHFEIYGSTPPRTRIKIKNRSWDRKQKMDNNNVKMRSGTRGRLARSRADRRNTVDCAILNQMIIEPSIDDKTRSDKRSIQIQRDFERDQKMANVGNAHRPIGQRSSLNMNSFDDALEATEALPTAPLEPKCIESVSRFMSVKSRPVGCRISAPPATFAILIPKMTASSESTPQTRREFHETFSNLIKLGSNDKQERNTRSMIISKEEQLWQTEVKDMIWLELQANMADRSLEQQDKFLFTARQSIGELLREIMNYRFTRKFHRLDSARTNDSGISGMTTSSDNPISNQSNGFCFGCLSMYCPDCLEAQTTALRQVESLLTRLEAAEDLFPSNKAMGAHFPLYNSQEFINRLKTMCLWYNLTRHHRLKLMILGKILARLQGKEYKWPLVESDTSSGSSSIQEPEADSAKGSSNEFKLPKVQFLNIDETDQIASATDSANSDESLKAQNYNNQIGEYGRLISSLNSWTKLDSLESIPSKLPTSPYRKFIENVLKSRGLGKSLSFLHRLHNVVLRKAHIALEKPGCEEQEQVVSEDDPISIIETPIDPEEVEELRRYGIWSEEFLQLALPSYISAFLFLSMIPLEVVHEFLKMKIETKPVQPNPLSLEQLIKELKEGLTLALIHRDRFMKHITAALVDRDQESEKYMPVIDEFDGTLKQIFEIYLEYVEQWILTGVPDSHRKTAMEDEWKFTKLTCPMINGEHAVAAKKFCEIIQKLLEAIGGRLTEKVNEMEKFSIDIPDESANNLTNGDKTDDDDEEEDASTIWKNKLLTMCREIQQIFTSEREKCTKLMSFTKVLFKDIEKDDFHRDHNTLDESSVCLRHSSCMCPEVLETINTLKAKTLELRGKLTSTLQKVQERSEAKYLIEMDEIDRQTVLTRCREILHVGYRFGFEYHKHLSALFETTPTAQRSSFCDQGLAKAIVGFARCWMQFVMGRCERGRGLRPRWAATGLDFLIIACDPHNTEQINEKEFEELKSAMDKCISHVIGSINEPERVRKSPRSRKSSPAPSRKRTPTRSSVSYTPTTQKILQQQMSLQVERSRLSPSPDPRDFPAEFLRKQTSYDNVSDISIKVPQSPPCYTPELRQTGTIKKVAEELKIFEGIHHRHLVKYYGVEIHREELLIFMELCAEGTLESLCEISGGLHEGLVRRYTTQLLSGVEELHKNGVVHRDIKCANVFLTNEGNCLKLGDFGSAVKIKFHTTMPGELKGYVGTQAYMAPEVFTKTNTEGHGRAADIWSVGCCVIEMASGKRPWYQFDSNFQIMFKVGMGESPEIPSTLSEEGIDFVECCLFHDPKERWTATELLQHHNFCKVVIGDECDCDDNKSALKKDQKTILN
ncbi:CLUMA_CG002214, isoform A [Clunio marinus]|uniref:CLUMA_CG002214, isoform A n=1 Tax=Clunio marinus TaxID=568069 RepID=A0A1J1HM45_9DIPT|nr:CLUMA_CG002214, isoform A [Clunio marinus]